MDRKQVLSTIKARRAAIEKESQSLDRAEDILRQWEEASKVYWIPRNREGGCGSYLLVESLFRDIVGIDVSGKEAEVDGYRSSLISRKSLNPIQKAGCNTWVRFGGLCSKLYFFAWEPPSGFDWTYGHEMLRGLEPPKSKGAK